MFVIFVMIALTFPVLVFLLTIPSLSWREPTTQPGEWAHDFYDIPGADKERYWSLDDERVYRSKYIFHLLRLLIHSPHLPKSYYDVSIPIDVRLGVLIWRCASNNQLPSMCIDAANTVFYNEGVLQRCDDIEVYFVERAREYADFFTNKKTRDSDKIRDAVRAWTLTL